MDRIGTRLHDLMLVPYYARLMYSVEGKIHEFDKNAQEEGICLTDANVKSALLKAIGFARGQNPSFTTKIEKYRAIRDLILLLKRIGDTIEVVAEGEDGVKITERVETSDWILILRAIEDSLKTRRLMYGHSRGYLDFLEGFIKEGRTL